MADQREVRQSTLLQRKPRFQSNPKKRVLSQSTSSRKKVKIQTQLWSQDKPAQAEDDVRENLAMPAQLTASVRLRSSQDLSKRMKDKPQLCFQDLPKEIRDKIFEYSVSISDPISIVEGDLICPSCGIHSDPSVSEIKDEFLSCYGAFQTCRVYRFDAFNAFIRVNNWRLECTRFHVDGRSAPLYVNGSEHVDEGKVAKEVLTTSLDQLVCHKHLAQDIKHFYLKVELCRGGTLQGTHGRLPATIGRKDPAAARAWLRAQMFEGESSWTKVSEKETSDEYQGYITNLVDAQAAGSCTPRSLNIDLVIHEVNTDLSKPHLNQCGLTLRIEVKFYPPGVTAHPAENSKQVYGEQLEPKRALLLPLLKLRNIQGVHVRRTWTLTSKSKGSSQASRSEHDEAQVETPMVQDFQYRDTQAFFNAVGEDLISLRGMGITEAGLIADDVVSIRENTPSTNKAIALVQQPSPLQTFGNEWLAGAQDSD